MLTIEIEHRDTEKIDFWDIPDHRAHFFPLVDGGHRYAGKELELRQADELDALVEDYRRVNSQYREMVAINPARADSYYRQLRGAVWTIEADIKKLLGSRVDFNTSHL